MSVRIMLTASSPSYERNKNSLGPGKKLDSMLIGKIFPQKQ